MKKLTIQNGSPKKAGIFWSVFFTEKAHSVLQSTEWCPVYTKLQ